MLKTILIYGAVSGAILAGLSWLIFTLCFSGHITLGQTTTAGYAGMLIALSMIFLGLKSYKDGHGGSISFWKAVQIGFMITLLASIIHSVSYQAYQIWNPGFREFYYQKFTEHLVSGLEQPASQEGIDEIKSQVRMVQTISEDPLLSLVFSIITLLPVGLIVTLISALLLRDKRKPGELRETSKTD